MKYLPWARPILMGVAVALVGVVAPATAKTFDANNAKRVDGLQASKFTDSPAKRKNRLVATNKDGLLPNNIVAFVQAAAHAQTAETAASADQAALANLAKIADDLSCASCVGADELQTANSPTAGQVLGFSSSGLDWQNAGTVTSVASGTGLAGGPVTGSGSLSLAPEYRLPQGCGSGQVAKSDGSGGWTCADDSADHTSAGSVEAGVQTTSTSYVALSGGPSVTVTVPTSGKVMVTVTAGVIPTSGNIAYMSVSPTGTCNGANDATALVQETNFAQASATYLFTGIGAGPHTFVACYRVNTGGNAQWLNRNLIVQPVS